MNEMVEMFRELSNMMTKQAAQIARIDADPDEASEQRALVESYLELIKRDSREVYERRNKSAAKLDLGMVVTWVVRLWCGFFRSLLSLTEVCSAGSSISHGGSQELAGSAAKVAWTRSTRVALREVCELCNSG